MRGPRNFREDFPGGQGGGQDSVSEVSMLAAANIVHLSAVHHQSERCSRCVNVVHCERGSL